MGGWQIWAGCCLTSLLLLLLLGCCWAGGVWHHGHADLHCAAEGPDGITRVSVGVGTGEQQHQGQGS